MLDFVGSCIESLFAGDNPKLLSATRLTPFCEKGKMMLLGKVRVGRSFSCLYPVHGKMNILRKVEGVVEKTGKGPNGSYVVVKTPNDGYRSLLCKKIVLK